MPLRSPGNPILSLDGSTLRLLSTFHTIVLGGLICLATSAISPMGTVAVHRHCDLSSGSRVWPYPPRRSKDQRSRSVGLLCNANSPIPLCLTSLPISLWFGLTFPASVDASVSAISLPLRQNAHTAQYGGDGHLASTQLH